MARKRHKKRSLLARTIVFALLLMMIGYPFYEATTLTRENRTVGIPGLPAELNGLRVVFVSDIHQGPFFSQTRVNNLVAEINSVNADIVIFGGDYADDSQGAVNFFKNLPKVHARLLVAGVPGNHDRTVPESNLAALQSAMLNAGIIPLVNTVREVRYRDISFYVAGIDDVDNGHPDVAGVAAQLAQEQFVIFVTHSPDGFAEAFSVTDKGGSPHWFDLGLAGHTHGGQIALLGNPLIQNFSAMPKEYYTGWHTANGAEMLVSNGVGTSVFPVRLFAKPMFHVITLTRGNQ